MSLLGGFKNNNNYFLLILLILFIIWKKYFCISYYTEQLVFLVEFDYFTIIESLYPSQSVIPECLKLVYYVPRCTMWVIAWRTTMLAEDQSRDKAETKPRRDQSCEHCRVSRSFPNCVHWHVFYFMWLRCVFEFLCVHSNLS